MSRILPQAIDGVNAARTAGIKEDFLVGAIGAATITSTVSGGTFALANNVIASNRWGIVAVTTGTGTTGRGSGAGGSLQLNAGYTVFETAILIPSLSTVSDEFAFDVGFSDQGATSNAPTEGVFFKYDRLTSVNWIRGTANASSTTATATSTAVSANTWIVLKFVIAANNSGVEFFVNGVSVGTNSTNVPSGSTTLKPYIRIIKSAGTTSVAAHCDYINYQVTFNTAR